MYVPSANIAVCFILFMALLTGFGASARPEPPTTIPSRDHCMLLELRMDEGWWLQIRRDEPAAYGFGALPQRVSVKTGTFSLEKVYLDIIDGVVESYPEAPVTVLFSPMAAGHDGRVFALKIDDAAVSELFATAYHARDQSLDDGFQQEAIRHLDPFWMKAPFLQ